MVKEDFVEKNFRSLFDKAQAEWGLMVSMVFRSVASMSKHKKKTEPLSASSREVTADKQSAISAFRHSRESGNPVFASLIFAPAPPPWMPACAGMTDFHVI